MRAAVQSLESRVLLSGTWTQLSQAAPGGIGTMLLLPDGSVMATINGASTDWARLTPNVAGSYLNGTWTRLASMHDTRLYDSSQILQDGRLFVAGGEYGSGSKTGEVYDPITNTWTSLPAQSFGAFSDSGSEMLPNGDVLIAPVGPSPSGYTVIFHPATNSWSLGPKLFRGGSADEQSWVKLADGSILSVDGANTSERYIPSLNQWVNDATVPVNLFDSQHELGAGMLLADGRALFIGATSQTAIYTPSGTSASGRWVAGPTLPNGLGAPDAPAAMLPDGTILCALGPSNTFNGPTSFYLYDPVANAFAPVSNAPSIGGAPFGGRMLDLPDGTVLYSSGGSKPYVYNPNTTALAAGQPTLTAIQPNGDGTFLITGTLFNGISEGASYGDDAQMNTNYPIVRFTGATGGVSYARTFNWSSTGVATGGATETANVVLPLGIAPGTYSVSVIANGIVSQPLALTIPTPADDAAPVVATPPAANPVPVLGTTTALSVLGDDAEGESNLTYTWTALSVPPGSPLPSYSINGSNAAKNTTATFYRAGNYAFRVFITDSAGLSVSSVVSLVVNQTESSVTVTPDKLTLPAGGSKQFTAHALDQFAQPMASQPAFSWTSTAGGISTGGLLIAPSSGTLLTVSASDGRFQGTAAVGVVSAPWASQDIGGVGITGLAYDANSAFTVSGSGSDIWGTSDQFRFVYRTMPGNGSITARVVSEQNTDPFAKIGVMIRNSLDPTDAFAFMDVTPGNGTAFQYRTTKGGQAANNNVGGFVAPYWVRLVRNGNTFLGYRSTNGVNWGLQFQTTIAMGTTAYVGLDVCAHNNSALNTAVFDHVTMSQVGVLEQAAANPNPVTGTTTNLSVLGTDPGAEALLKYTWSSTVIPQGAAAPVLSINGTNAAKNTVATFDAPGDYTFVVAVSDGTGLIAISTINVTVLTQPATVTAVSVGWGTGSSAPLQTAADGLRLLPAGRNTDLPWAGINQIVLTLSQPQSLVAGDVSVTGLTVPNYGPVTISGDGTTYTITLAQPITGAERLALTIGNANIVAFNRELDVLPADVSDDGTVGFTDLLTLAQNYGAANVDWNAGDLNGDGSVNFSDLLALAQSYGTTLPAATPLVRAAAGRARAPTLAARSIATRSV